MATIFEPPRKTSDVSLELEGDEITLEGMRRIAIAYWGPRGDFVYRAYEWANSALFRDRIGVPLFQWALTLHGKCLGELLHVYVECLLVDHDLVGWSRPTWQSSHNNDIWASQVMRISPLLGLGKVIASRTKRKRHNGRMLTVPVIEGSIFMRALSTWPWSLRNQEHHIAEGELPFEWKCVSS
jgi:hypothetical protein